MKPGVLITGASGFVGTGLFQRFQTLGTVVRCAGRKASLYSMVAVGEINGETRWAEALEHVQTVVHLAARAHIIKDVAENALEAFRLVNVLGTRRLAEEAARMGVRRFVFVSSIGVNGNQTNGRKPFSIADAPMPTNDYAVSKWEAEQALWEVARATGLEIVVVRPPLVYGPTAKGNFARLLKLVQRGTPLPLGSVQNLRSFVGLDNLVDLLIRCTQHPRAAGQTFLVSDGEDISTPEVIRRMARAMNRPARLLPFPSALMRMGGRLLGRSAEVERLIGSLQVDMRHTCQTLDWTPPVSVGEGLARAVTTV